MNYIKEIDNMIYCHEIEKWVTIEEYTDYYYGGNN